MRLLSLVVLSLFFRVASASAEPPCSWTQAGKRAGIAAAILGVWEVSELSKGRIINGPRWVDDPINPLDSLGEKLRWTPGILDEGAKTLSDNMLVITVVSTGLVAFAGEAKGACLVEDLAAVGEAVGLSLSLNQAVKFGAARERPFTRDLAPEEREAICAASASDCADLDLSFFSGHSSTSFTIALAAGTVASLKGYDSAAAAYSFGVFGAGLTAYLRVAAGKHYLSDVLVGALVGGASGLLIPRYVHPVGGSGAPRALVLPTALGAPGLAVVGSF